MTSVIDRFALHAGPYVAPSVRRGNVLYCQYRQDDVAVGGYTDAPIPWPRVLKTGRPSLIVCDGLADAVHVESELAIAHWWGVSVALVWAWRKALGVGRVTHGTGVLYQLYAPIKLPEDTTRKGLASISTPEIRSRIAETQRGRVAPEHVRKALLDHASAPKSDGWKAGHAERMKQQWADGSRTNASAWRTDEIALLGTAPDRTVSEITGRTIAAVRGVRARLGIPAYTATVRSKPSVYIFLSNLV